MAVDFITGTDIISTTFFFGLGKNGWTETFLHSVTGALGRPKVAVRSWIENYCRLRRRFLSTSAKIEAVRVSNDHVLNDSVLLDEKDIPDIKEGDVPGNFAHVDTAILAQLSNGEGEVRANHVFRGLPQTLLPATFDAGLNQNNPAHKNLILMFIQLETLITTPSAAPSFANGSSQVVMRTHTGRNPDNVALPVVASAIVNGKLEISVKHLSPSTRWEQGDKIHVYASRKKCVRGLSGSATITSAAFSDLVGIYKLDRKPCCAPSDLSDIKMSAQRRARGYVKAHRVTLRGFTDRDTGRAFFAGVGRRPARCC